MCDLERARKLSKELGREVHPWELYFGMESLESKYLRKYPSLPIYYYERWARWHKIEKRELDPHELWSKDRAFGLPLLKNGYKAANNEKIVDANDVN